MPYSLALRLGESFTIVDQYTGQEIAKVTVKGRRGKFNDQTCMSIKASQRWLILREDQSVEDKLKTLDEDR